jgi:hypothetical protein
MPREEGRGRGAPTFARLLASLRRSTTLLAWIVEPLRRKGKG